MRRILTVDDDPLITDIISKFLESSEYEIIKAYNGKQALEIFKKEKPDLVLTDINMPKIDGLNLLKKIKEISPATMVIVISGAGDFNDAIMALHLGAWDYIIKPFTQTVLERAVYRAFEHIRLDNEVKRSHAELEQKNIKLIQSLEKLKEDQKAGRAVQEQLLPKTKVYFKNIQITHKILPSLYLSGDFADYFAIEPDKIGFYIADVSGHGASSAFVTVLLKGLVEKLIEQYNLKQNEIILQPDQVLKYISDAVLQANLGKYLTMVYCILDQKSNILTYSVGGHHPNPIIFDGNEAKYLPGSGYAVGIYHNPKFENYSLTISEKSIIGMFSDGIFEMLKQKNLSDKEDELIRIFGSSKTSITSLLDKLNIHEHQNFPDDMTFLLIKTQPPETSKRPNP